MRWVGIGLGIGLLMVIAGYALGLFLPTTYQANSSRTFAASREEVWQVINDYQKNPVSADMAVEITPLVSDDGGAAWVEDIGASSLSVRTLSSERHKSILREVQDSVVPVHSTINIRLANRDGMTTVHISNKTKILNGTWHVPLFRLSLFSQTH